jgi:hypothetical protein
MSASQRKTNSVTKALAQAGLNTSRVSQSSIILIRPITAGATTYEFPVLDNVGVPLADEIRLALQDIFIVNAIGIFLMGEIVGPGGTLRARTYFTAPPVQASAGAIPLLNLYLGNLQYNLNNVTYLENWDLQRHYNKGQAQLLGVSTVNGAIHQFDQQAGNTSGFFPVEPSFTLAGTAKSNFTITLPNNLLTPVAGIPFDAGNADNILVNFDRIAIVARGLLGQNSSSING